MLLFLRVRAAEATLDLGLTAVKQRVEDASRRLTRLGATWVGVGDPHEDEHASTDPMDKIRIPMIPGLTPPVTTSRRGVNVTLTATWDVAGRPTEEVLRLADRLRFEAAADDEPEEPAPDVPAWASPEEQMRQLMARAAVPPKQDVSPKFLYVARPADEVMDRLAAEAYARARRAAERLARAAGRRLGGLSSTWYGTPISAARMMRLQESQTMAAVLATGSYVPADGEIVTDDPRAAELTVSVHAIHVLE
jgi:hypothetical protein